MYHCGTAPVVHHIANGMYGMIIVEPKGGLPPVDRELAFVQSEFYLGATPGATADNTKLMANAPDVVAFNGYAGQYKENPITVNRGERIRVFVLAAGPNTWSAFHVVGTMFDRAWIDGIYPENLTRGNQTLNLAASQGRGRRVPPRRGRGLPLRHARVHQRRKGSRRPVPHPQRPADQELALTSSRRHQV